jgi:hypothetical protein
MQAKPAAAVPVSVSLSTEIRAGTLHDLQRELRREARGVLLQSLRGALRQVEKAIVSAGILCPSCQRPMRSRGRSARRIVTVFGPLSVQRARYACQACGTVRRPLDEWMGLTEGTEYTAAVREQALYLAADLSYDAAADVLRHVAGIGMSGRQIQRLLQDEGSHLEDVLGEGADAPEDTLRHRFRRSGKTKTTAGAQRVLQLRQLKTSGRWDEYWLRRFQQERAAPKRATRPRPNADATIG